MYYQEELNTMDSVRAIVTGYARNGLFLMLENGEEAYASFGGLTAGTEVICTVRKKAREGNLTLVAIDGLLKRSSCPYMVGIPAAAWDPAPAAAQNAA